MVEVVDGESKRVVVVCDGDDVPLRVVVRTQPSVQLLALTHQNQLTCTITHVRFYYQLNIQTTRTQNGDERKQTTVKPVPISVFHLLSEEYKIHALEG